MQKTILKTDRLSIGYPGHVLARNLSLEIGGGDVLAVLGHNGSGKTTFVKTLLGVLPSVDGSFDWPNGHPSELGYLAQLSEFDRRFPIRVRDLAAMGAWKGFGFHRGVDRTTRQRITAAMDATGVLDIQDQSLHTLSGGQLQRALFARVIVQDAPLILLDEPFAGVDQKTEAALLEIIRGWSDEGRAVVLVLHDLSSVLDHCSHALLFGDGRARFGSVDDVITVDNLVDQNYMSASQAAWMLGARSAAMASEPPHA